MRRMTQPRHSVFLRALASVLAAAGGLAPAPAAEMVLDGHAAFVNDRAIMISDVLRYTQAADRQAARTVSPERLDDVLDQNYRDGLQALIERELILVEAERRHLDLPDPAVDAQIKQLIRERFGGDSAAFRAALAADGLSYEAYRAQIRNDLRAMLLRRQEVTDRIALTPGAVQKAYRERIEQYRQPERVRVRLLVVRKGRTDAEIAAKRRLAETARERALRGEPFEALVKELSEGPAVAEGGDLGWREPRELRPELAAAVRVLQPGSVSGVLDVGDEFHIVFLEGRREAKIQPLSEVAAEIERDLQRAAIEQRMAAWMSELRTRNFVRIVQEERP